MTCTLIADQYARAMYDALVPEVRREIRDFILKLPNDDRNFSRNAYTGSFDDDRIDCVSFHRWDGTRLAVGGRISGHGVFTSEDGIHLTFRQVLSETMYAALVGRDVSTILSHPVLSGEILRCGESGTSPGMTDVLIARQDMEMVFGGDA